MTINPNGRPSVARLAYSPTESAAALGISRARLYELFRQGDLKAKKIGNRTLILAAELDRFLADLPNK